MSDVKYVQAKGIERTAPEFIAKGDRYAGRWHNWDGKAEGEITQANGKDHIEFSFEGSMVSVRLEETFGMVIVPKTIQYP